MDFKVTPVSLDRIETADRTFKITTNTDKIDLALSISAIGLLQPPVLIKNRRDYTVVCGFKRIAACETLNIASIPARILHPDSPKIACAQIAISDNSYQRPLNIVEQSRAYALIRRFADSSTSWLKIAESAGLARSQTAMDRIMPVAGMPISLQDAILDGSIALPIALHINQLNKDDAMSLCRFFRQITTGLNIQRELLALISEISFRDDISIARLIEQDEIAVVMENGDSPAPQKVRELRMMLKVKRYPELSKAEAAYNQKMKALKLNPYIQLQPPRFFEGKAYRLTLTVDSRRQLKSLQSELEKLVYNPSPLPE
ncbi:MAG: ParB/RepB/Spo0J family partition protein [Desulfosarcina sp.]|nr:ParB/RepB/Spo0J family partition protein [Desulfosarcina sp.]MBC2741969.1 ParB/RepB/Spo0J family partition protein [Desulfosarcina sp.]MBC2764882.1 ParB/RepB/Spo0J family partition protein [Desulfosarcina sp.]